jgi:hypothetical protein
MRYARVTESIRLFRNGKPDVKDIHVPNLIPSDYPVPDVDTTMKVFKKDGDYSRKFFTANDDCIADSKAAGFLPQDPREGPR